MTSVSRKETMNSLDSVKALFPGNSLKMGAGGIGIIIVSFIAPVPSFISKGLLITGVLGILAMLLLIVADKLDKKYQIDNTRELAKLERERAKAQNIKDKFGAIVREQMEPNVNRAAIADGYVRDKEFKEWEQAKLEKEQAKKLAKANV